MFEFMVSSGPRFSEFLIEEPWNTDSLLQQNKQISIAKDKNPNPIEIPTPVDLRRWSGSELRLRLRAACNRKLMYDKQDTADCITEWSYGW